jgi:hypothetical protein
MKRKWRTKIKSVNIPDDDQPSPFDFLKEGDDEILKHGTEEEWATLSKRLLADCQKVQDEIDKRADEAFRIMHLWTLEVYDEEYEKLLAQGKSKEEAIAIIEKKYDTKYEPMPEE